MEYRTQVTVCKLGLYNWCNVLNNLNAHRTVGHLGAFLCSLDLDGNSKYKHKKPIFRTHGLFHSLPPVKTRLVVF